MPRFKLIIEYDGSGYCGWQRQDNAFSIQHALERAFHRFCGEVVTVHGAGRTDAGVHALGQVAHVDLSRDWPSDTVRSAVNAHLSGDTIAVLDVASVDDVFDARFLASMRHYRYRIINRRAPLCIDAGRAWHVPKPLDIEAMHDAAQIFIGKYDFTTFRAAQCQAKSPVRTIKHFDVHRTNDSIYMDVSALSFLHNQVRSFAGSLKRVGEGAWSANRLKAALEACNRAACGPVAPPEGLYLMQVDYE